MVYPEWLKAGSVIGIPAPSDGIGEDRWAKFDLSLEHLRKAGFQVRETASVRSGLSASASGEIRGKEFMELVEDENIDLILCAAGGEFLIEMLPFLDYGAIRKHPKWIQGYSDPTGILFGVTTRLDIATIYGGNGGAFGMTKLHPSLEENLALWQGRLSGQSSYDRYELERVEDYDGYYLSASVEWKTPNGPVNVSGRLIGGCMDCLLDLLGTPYENAAGFAKRYGADGIVWYFDVFDMAAESVYRTLLHMRSAGWFEHAKGFIFGRVRFPHTLIEMTYEEAVLRALGSGTPVILEADVGHVSPRMTFVNGCVAHVRAADGKGNIRYEWRA